MPWLRIACALLLLTSSAANATSLNEQLTTLIECRARMPDFIAMAPLPETLEDGASRGMIPLPQKNPFMTEFSLAEPITVFGHSTSLIAFSGTGVVAIIDLPDPRPLAHELQMEVGLDTPNKVLYGLEVLNEELEPDPSGMRWIESVVLNVSNVTSHPNKTLVGCSYSIDQLENEDAAAASTSNDG